MIIGALLIRAYMPLSILLFSMGNKSINVEESQMTDTKKPAQRAGF
ncbi:hypothetical protein IFVP408_C1240054 [Vibrio parahaemolyticus]